METRSKAGSSKVQAAMALNSGDESKLLSKDALAGLEEAVEAHVPDILNPYGRYRQTGCSAFVDPNNDSETVTNPSAQNKALAQEHIVGSAYAHEPLQELTHLLADYGEYASALYASGAVSLILERDGLSTLTLSRAYVTETILTLAMGDPIAAEENFMNRHVQKTAYLSSRECKLAEELFRAVKTRDIDALEEARDPNGPNRTGLANLHPVLRQIVSYIRLSGVARKTVGDTVSSDSKDKKSKLTDEVSSKQPEPSLNEILNMKTGYEGEVAEGANLDSAALNNELDALDLGDDDDLEDDDFDLR
jgi:Soluble NSF attachment protein, SNAP